MGWQAGGQAGKQARSERNGEEGGQKGKCLSKCILLVNAILYCCAQCLHNTAKCHPALWCSVGHHLTACHSVVFYYFNSHSVQRHFPEDIIA